MKRSLPDPVIYRGEFFIRGAIPSKKNGKMLITRDRKGNALPRPRTITDPEVQTVLAYIVLQAKAAWRGKPPLTDAYVGLTFYVSHLAADLDNRASSVLDSFVKARVLQNDNMKHIRKIVLDWVLAKPSDEGVHARLEGVAFIEKGKKGRAA